MRKPGGRAVAALRHPLFAQLAAIGSGAATVAGAVAERAQRGARELGRTFENVTPSGSPSGDGKN